jgi:pyruvate formate lyase activating enzyme
MKFKGFAETSFVDWDGKVSSVVFTPGCNFRCPFCFNKDLVLKPETLEDVPEEFIFDFLEKQKDFIDGVSITGGEPTMMVELPGFCEKLKEKGFLVKLDTNGSNFEILKDLIEKKLIDFVAMDIKGPWDIYSNFTGVTKDVESIKKSAEFLMSSGIDYEFRTTVIPSLHSLEVFEKMVTQIKGAKKYCIQKFRPGMCIDPSFNSEKAQTDEEIQPYVEIAKKYVDKVKFRGK